MKGYPVVTKYCQKDARWGNKRLGNSSYTLGLEGCFVTSLAMIDGRTPLVVNNLLTQNGGLTAGGLVIHNAAAKILGLKYNGVTTQKQYWLAIAETNYYANLGFPTHFFVWLGDGQIVDPLDGKQKKNSYPITEYFLYDNGKGKTA